MRREKIRILVVEDSPTARDLLVHILNAEPDLEVIKTVQNGDEALAAVQHDRPDLVTMDVQLPGLDGYLATRAIMESFPVPIIVVSNNVNRDDLASSFQALEAGAVMALRKPVSRDHPDYETLKNELVMNVRLMSEIKVVRRLAKYRTGLLPAPGLVTGTEKREFDVVAIGASTGGPIVLQQILTSLSAGFPTPILIVQHMAQGFVAGMVEWLDQSSELTVQIAQKDEIALPGHVYIAPDGQQFYISRGARLGLIPEAASAGFCPSATYLFRSVAAEYGARAIGVLLSGMGEDGAFGLKLMRDKGALTIAQDERSCVVFGMPAEAIRLGAVERVLAPSEIPLVLTTATRRETKTEFSPH